MSEKPERPPIRQMSEGNSGPINFHIKLKQYRVIYASVTAFIAFMVYKMWSFYELNFMNLSAESAAAFSAMFLGLIPMLKFALENSRQDKDHD